MANMKLCCVFDEKAEVFSQPFAVSAIGIAERDFTQQVKGDAKMFAVRADFSLYYVGDWESSDSTFTNLQPPKLLIRGSDIPEA